MLGACEFQEGRAAEAGTDRADEGDLVERKPAACGHGVFKYAHRRSRGGLGLLAGRSRLGLLGSVLGDADRCHAIHFAGETPALRSCMPERRRRYVHAGETTALRLHAGGV